MKELKKCPFCGGEATASTGAPVRGSVVIGCGNQKCKVRPCVVGWTFGEAADAWNERVQEERGTGTTAKEYMRDTVLYLKALLKTTKRGRVVRNLILSNDQKELAIDWADCNPTIVRLEDRDGMDVINYVTASL